VDEALCGRGGNGLGITNVSFSKTNKRGGFEITWETNVPVTGKVTFICCGVCTDSSLVISQRMTFSGSKGVLFEFYIHPRIQMVMQSQQSPSNIKTKTTI